MLRRCLNVTIAQMKEGTEVSCNLWMCKRPQIIFAKAYRDFNDEKPQTKTNVDNQNKVTYQMLQLYSVTAAQQQQAIGFQYRGKMSAEESLSVKLYNLRLHKPLEYAQVVEARKGFDYITRNEGLFNTVFSLFTHLHTNTFKKTHPRVPKSLLGTVRTTLKRTSRVRCDL